MSTNKYYPSLSTVVTLEDFPDDLGFIKKGIQEIFTNIPPLPRESFRVALSSSSKLILSLDI